MNEVKFVCPFCGFESSGAGVCPTCDELLEKRCLDEKGEYSAQSCLNENNQENAEEKKLEELIKAEVEGEAIKELTAKEIQDLKEAQELADNETEEDEEE